MMRGWKEKYQAVGTEVRFRTSREESLLPSKKGLLEHRKRILQVKEQEGGRTKMKVQVPVQQNHRRVLHPLRIHHQNNRRVLRRVRLLQHHLLRIQEMSHSERKQRDVRSALQYGRLLTDNMPMETPDQKRRAGLRHQNCVDNCNM